jgi:hypothetical protein
MLGMPPRPPGSRIWMSMAVLIPVREQARERSLRKAGLRHLPFHSLRHTAVSLLIAHEHRSPKQLQTIVGHAGVSLTFNTYGHLMPDAFGGFGSALDALGHDGAARAQQGHNGGTPGLQALDGGA